MNVSLQASASWLQQSGQNICASMSHRPQIVLHAWDHHGRQADVHQLLACTLVLALVTSVYSECAADLYIQLIEGSNQRLMTPQQRRVTSPVGLKHFGGEHHSPHRFPLPAIYAMLRGQAGGNVQNEAQFAAVATKAPQSIPPLPRVPQIRIPLAV